MAVQMANHGKMALPCAPADCDSTPDKAPVGPTMLNSLPPVNAATNPAQKAVTTPATGVPPPAMDKAIERGMLTNATVVPLRRFPGIWEMTHRSISHDCATTPLRGET